MNRLAEPVRWSALAARLFRPRGPQSIRAGLWLAIALAVLFLGYALLGSAGQIAGLDSAVERSIVADILGLPSLQRQLAFFLLASLALHALFGVGVWLLALLTEQALPAWRGRRRRLVLAWMALSIVWTTVADAALFRWSRSGGNWPFARAELLGPVTVFDLVTVLFVAAIAFVVTGALVHHHARRLILRVAVWGALAVGTATVLLNLPQGRAHLPGDVGRAPNVIVIGIDALRADVVSGDTGWYTPNLANFLRDSQLLPDAITPMARTFPSWMATLTGRHPVATRARDNLIPRRELEVGDSLQLRLRAAGYRAVYATDEVRFSNIDASYGFDQVIGPRIGVSDFFLASLNEAPLANLIANTRLGGWLFPDTHANRAAAATYDPHTFIELLDRKLDLENPAFVAVHLTLPHWPLRWANSASDPFADDPAAPYPYLASVVAADRQFGELLRLLGRRGALDNAIVVLLSDHGEGLGLGRDNLIAGKEARKAVGPLRVAMWGHGTSVLSPHQYSVLLAFKGYGPAGRKLAAAGAHTGVPASLEDVPPTLLELLGMPSGDGFDGVSLAPVLQGRDAPDALLRRVRFTESALSPRALARGDVVPRELISEGIESFTVNPDSGRVEMRMDRWDELLATKERAAIQGDWLLAALPGDSPGENKYVLASRESGLPRRLNAEPDATSDPVAAALWAALHRRFPGELGRPVPLPAEPAATATAPAAGNPTTTR